MTTRKEKEKKTSQLTHLSSNPHPRPRLLLRMPGGYSLRDALPYMVWNVRLPTCYSHNYSCASPSVSDSGLCSLLPVRLRIARVVTLPQCFATKSRLCDCRVHRVLVVIPDSPSCRCRGASQVRRGWSCDVASDREARNLALSGCSAHHLPLA